MMSSPSVIHWWARGATIRERLTLRRKLGEVRRVSESADHYTAESLYPSS